MHIKHIHDTIEKLSQYACEEACKSKESINTEELGEVIDMVKDLSEAEYYARISKAMEQAEKEDEEEAKYIMKKMKDEYGEEEGERRFYDNYRYKSSGRFAPKGRGSYMPIRGYEEPPYYHTMPETYNSMEHYRDMDRANGKMYFAEPSMSRNAGNYNTSSDRTGNMSGMRDGREGRSGMSRRSYMETKEMNKGNTPEEKQRKMKELEAYTKELAEDVTEMISDATPEEKALLKQKMQVLMQKI